MILSFILIIYGILYTQPFRILERKCLAPYYPRIVFVVSFICILISIIAFTAGDSVCFGNDEFKNAYTPTLEFSLGPSIILDILALILILPCCIISM